MEINEFLDLLAKAPVDAETRIHDGKRIMQQGDIYIHPVAADHPRGAPIANRQLAEGNTKGSRHILEGGVQVFAGTTRPTYVPERFPLGPCFVVAESAHLTHPEHAWLAMGAGTYQVTYQLNALTGRAVED